MSVSSVPETDAVRFQEAMDGFFGSLPGTVGVMVQVLGTDETLTYNHTEMFPTASTLKAPLLYELYRQADAGMVDLSARVTLLHKDRVPGSGVYQHLDEGLTPTIRDLAELMITVSDNWATDIIFGLLGKDQIANTLNQLGMSQTFLPKTIHEMFCALAELDPSDPKASYAELKAFLKVYQPAPDNIGLASDERNDVSSPADMVRLMTLIDDGYGLTPKSREAVIDILKHQNLTSIIPARLPTGSADRDGPQNRQPSRNQERCRPRLFTQCELCDRLHEQGTDRHSRGG